jgi:hypothetical protein
VIVLPTATVDAACVSLLAPRLQVGRQGRVTVGGVPNNIRLEPAIGSNRLGQIEPGTTFDVLEGPVCNGGYVWYRVKAANFEGWTAEGGNNAYWLEPVP